MMECATSFWLPWMEWRKWGECGMMVAAPPPKNVEQDIYECVDRKNKDNFFTTNLL
jgi:hypothetical protein